MSTRLTKFLTSAAMLVLLASTVAYAAPASKSESEAPHWSYDGSTGPEHWAHLNAEYAACSAGVEQSPIDIHSDEANKSGNKTKVTVHYKPTTFTFGNSGHTIQANTSSAANQLTIGDTKYTLAQFHFHTPSEHLIDGKTSPLELHFVHKSKTGNLAVLGVLIKEGKGNTALTEIWAKLPKTKSAADFVLKNKIDLSKLLPSDLDAYRYQGSLTTPPCSEGVKWTVLEKPIEMSKAQIKAFQAIFPDNHRPVQPQNKRTIAEIEVKAN